MKYSIRLAIAIGMALGTVTIANATQPPDPVASDAKYNTAVGSFAIYDLTSGSLNTAIGYEALEDNQSGSGNTALGASALLANSSGNDNTATGNYALHLNSNGTGNTVSGFYAMYHNINGGLNTVSGYQAMQANVSGTANTVSGSNAMDVNQSGSDNAAFGAYSLYSSKTGSENVAIGMFAMDGNIAGGSNVAVGHTALFTSNGSLNVAIGEEAMYSNSTGDANVAIGQGAMFANTAGSSNIAIGSGAGTSINGSDDVAIANGGQPGESGVIRIGDSTKQSKTFIAGIENSKITGNAVFVTASGQLGVLASSERYKTAIKSMGPISDKLSDLRPVSFHLKNDPAGMVQYGLIAEEVDKVYPELVIHDEAGKIQGVRYDELAPLLLNEVQQQRAELSGMKQQLADLKKVNEAMQAAVATLQQRDRLAMR